MAIVDMRDWLKKNPGANFANFDPKYGASFNEEYFRQLGIGPGNYRNVRGVSTQDWAKSKSTELFKYNGYYDNNAYTKAMAGLGGTSSDTLLKQVNEFNSGTSKFFNLMGDFNTYKSWYNNIGGVQLQSDFGVIATGKSRDEQLYNSWLGMQEYGKTLNQQAANLGQELTAQFGREQGFLSTVTGLTQTATVAKLKADQAKQQAEMQKQYQQQQAALNQQNAANQAALAKQKAEQDKQYAEAQAAADKAAKEQLVDMNETAQITAVSNAATAAQQMAQTQTSALETRANTLQGNVTVTTNASTTSKQKGSTSRTDRWLSRRAPDSGGGGARI